MADDALAQIAQPAIGAARNQSRQICAHRADRRSDGHVVVVEDDDEPRIYRAGIVHRLIRHARAHGAVADHGDDVVMLALQIARDRKCPGRQKSRSRNARRRTGHIRFRARLVKPERPPPWRKVRMRDRRPVRILCG